MRKFALAEKILENVLELESIQEAVAKDYRG